MSTGERYSGYSAKFGFATGDSMVVNQMVGWDMDSGTTKSEIIPSGAVDRAAVLTTRQNPEFTLRTQDLFSVLTDVDPQSGKCFDEASTFFLQERADCGTFLAGGTATHMGRRTQKAFMVIDSIAAEQDSDDGAMLNARFFPQKSGANVLVEHVAGTALTGVAAPAYVSSFALGPVYHAGAEIKGVMGVTLNFNNNVVPAPSSPGGEPDFHSIVARTPEFSFRCLKIDNFDGFKASGTPVTTSFAFYFQKMDATNAVGDGRVAVGTATHVKVSGTAGDFDVRTLGADGQEDAAVEVVLRPTGSVTTSVASAIP